MDEMFDQHSVNAGWDDDDEDIFPTIPLVSSDQIGFMSAIIIPCCPDTFVYSKCDWSRYYRQLVRAASLLWCYGSMTTPAGVTLDLRLVFGKHTTAPHEEYANNRIGIQGLRIHQVIILVLVHNTLMVPPC